ncbi:MAG: YegS/Rv2252/BmrU family lipid kinase [Chthonomonas sp.]|nr:YegS/Rv2252/BmrU family lipid kinase [Chthonomonas sp.]
MSTETVPARGSLFMNAGSRRGQQWCEPAIAALRATGFELIESKTCQKVDQLKRGVKSAIDRGDPLVIVGGGDGTLSAVTPYFLESETIMGVMPLGTGNSFARDLQIPSQVEAAAHIIRDGKVREIDVSQSGDRMFLNVASVGLTTQIALALTGDQKRILGRAAYLIALVKGLARLKKFRCKLTVDGSPHEFTALQVVIGNGRYHAGPFPVSPNAQITDGRLNIYAITGEQKSALFRAALRLPGGKHVDLNEVPVYSGQTCRLETWPPRKVNLDGEIIGRTPKEFKVLPGALRCVVPADFA